MCVCVCELVQIHLIHTAVLYIIHFHLPKQFQRIFFSLFFEKWKRRWEKSSFFSISRTFYFFYLSAHQSLSCKSHRLLWSSHHPVSNFSDNKINGCSHYIVNVPVRIHSYAHKSNAKQYVQLKYIVQHERQSLAYYKVLPTISFCCCCCLCSNRNLFSLIKNTCYALINAVCLKYMWKKHQHESNDCLSMHSITK